MSELAYAIASVSESDWEYKIDSNVSVAFSVLPSSDQCLNPSSDVAFCKSTCIRVGVSKFSTSVRNCKFSSNPFLVFDVNKDTFSKWEE